MFYTKKGKLKNFGFKSAKERGHTYVVFDKETKEQNIHISKVLKPRNRVQNKVAVRQLIQKVIKELAITPKAVPNIEKLELDVLKKIQSRLS